MRGLVLIVVCVLTGCSSAGKQNSQLKPILVSSEPSLRNGYADVNGMRMYYEVHGNGPGAPLVLLHGGGSSIEVTYSKILPFLAKDRTVIAVDEQAHGRSSDRKGPVRFETTADDIAALLKHLEVKQADVMGFSNGASNALQVAIRHPELVRRLVFISAFTKRSGAYKGFWEMMNKASFSDMPQALKDAYIRIHDDPIALKNMHDKDLERMRNFKDVPDQQVRAIKAPTLIVLGDRDIVTTEHAVWLTQQIQGSRLLVVPGTHGDFLGEITQSPGDSKMPELTAGLVNEFLK